MNTCTRCGIGLNKNETGLCSYCQTATTVLAEVSRKLHPVYNEPHTLINWDKWAAEAEAGEYNPPRQTKTGEELS
jgi:predicted amidophosphoribosyltransferase